MTRFTSVLGMTVCAAVLFAVSTISNVSAHGYMNYPTPRGIQKLSTMVDDVKNPNTKGKCRGEPAGQVTNISGSSVTLQFTITAPHIGPCSVYLLDENLGNEQKIADKNDCAAPGKVGPWTVNLPAGVSGRKVIRWHWKASHLAPQIENYEQCADIMIGGGGGSSGKSSAPSANSGSSSSGSKKRPSAPSEESSGPPPSKKQKTVPKNSGGKKSRK
ncbi:hypothetical protein BDF19DRAFT_452580 [Syncephalis fuscata]|nr:hypothetical protein BDF19DRAFT_452580 [Syncephalis fuscata]